MGLWPVVRLRGRCLYHRSMEMEDRSEAPSPESCVLLN